MPERPHSYRVGGLVHGISGFRFVFMEELLVPLCSLKVVLFFPGTSFIASAKLQT